MSTKSKNKFLKWLSEVGQNWAMNTDPVVMQASGYKPTKTGVEYRPSEGAEQLRSNIAVISTVPNMVVNAGITGIIPAIASEVGAAAGGYAGSYAGQKLDEKYGTAYWTPIGGFAGALIGGGLGYKGGNKFSKYAIKNDLLPEGAVKSNLVTEELAKEAVMEMVDGQLAKSVAMQELPANIGWSPAQKTYWWHHSNEPITKFKVPFKERWDVVNHDADPYLIWLTKENGAAGMMAERPYHQQFKVALKKPMVQVGEVQTIPGQKNTSRNAIVKTARDMGADAVIFDGIADNKLQNQQVVAVFGDKVTPSPVQPTIRVFKDTGLGLGKNNPHALSTTPESVYRVTGQDQIDDIMSSGFIRPKLKGKVKGGHTNEVHFAQGDPNLFYYDKRPVIEISTQDIVDGQIGAIPKDKIKAIWQWSDSEGKYVNSLNILKR